MPLTSVEDDNLPYTKAMQAGLKTSVLLIQFSTLNGLQFTSSFIMADEEGYFKCYVGRSPTITGRYCRCISFFSWGIGQTLSILHCTS
jgi:hypothetical protein